MESRSLSPNESRIILSLEADGREAVGIDDIQALGGVSRSYARKLAHDLARKGWLTRVGRGRYVVNPATMGPDAIPEMNPFRLGSHLVDPYYFGYSTAANLHGFLTQSPGTYNVVTPTDTRRSLNEPAAFNLVHIKRAKFFGGREATKYGARIRVSDREKTVLDCLDRPDLAGGIANAVQIIYHSKPGLDHDRLLSYVERMDNKSLAQRLGYLLESVRPEEPVPADFLDALRELAGESYIHLAPASRHGRKGRPESSWRVIVNVPDAELFGEVTVR